MSERLLNNLCIVSTKADFFYSYDFSFVAADCEKQRVYVIVRIREEIVVLESTVSFLSNTYFAKKKRWLMSKIEENYHSILKIQVREYHLALTLSLFRMNKSLIEGTVT